MPTYSVSFSAPGKTLLEAVNNPANWGSIPSGMGEGPVSALKQAVVNAIRALNPTDSFPTTGNASQLHGTTLSVVASINTSTHTVSVVIS